MCKVANVLQKSAAHTQQSEQVAASNYPAVPSCSSSTADCCMPAWKWHEALATAIAVLTTLEEFTAAIATQKNIVVPCREQQLCLV